MAGLKELADRDRRGVFVSLADFAEEHTVAGSLIACVIDSDVHAVSAPELGVESADFRLFAAAEDVAPRREAGDILEVDGSLYAVTSWQEDMGVARVSLSASRSAY